MIQRFEGQFEKLHMSDSVIAVKKCIVVAYEIITFGMYTLDERKT